MTGGILLLLLSSGAVTQAPADPHPRGSTLERYFAEEVWAKIGERTCLNCHNADGDASDSKFLLKKPSLARDTLDHNRTAFEKMALRKTKGKSRILQKVTGGLRHGGKAVLKPDTTGYHILERYVRLLEGAPFKPADLPDYDAPPFFDGIRMMEPERLLRRVTLSLAARLPSKKELASVRKDGIKAINPIMDGIMKEDVFYDRLHEAFNDILLTVGYDDVAESALSYEHFKTRLWYQKYDLSEIKDKKKQQRARWALARVYRDAIYREPYELIKHIVRNEKSFTEIVTADYIMVSPYTSRGYGIFETLKDKFKDPDDPFEYIPAQLPALVRRNGKPAQESKTGRYPHSGILTMFQYLRRYPTTVTNRNRLRARMYYQHFLGIDIMALVPRVTDAAAVAKKYKNPTMEAPDCVVCHIRVDPLAGIFQDYFNEKGYYGPRKEGWFTDMFEPGFENIEKLPKDEKWRSIQWLGQKTAKDPRFAVAMVEHVYYILFGRKPLLPPEGIDDPMFGSKRRAYRVQRRKIEEIAGRFAKNGFNLKDVFKEWVVTDFYRVDGLAAAAAHPRRKAELDDLGVVRLLTPEQLERKITAIFGIKWGRLQNGDGRFGILYGGIDSKAVTERMTDPSGAMGAIQRIMSNAIACDAVPVDFTTEPGKRRLFPDIEPDVVPGDGLDAKQKIRKAIVHLHGTILGQSYAEDHPEVDRTYQLFTGILEDARAQKSFDKRESYFCKGSDKARVGHDKAKRVNDPKYTVRAWRAVVTYLLRQHDFLYE